MQSEGLFSKKATGWFKGLAIIMVILSHFAEWWSWFQVEEGVSEMIRYGISRFGPYGVGIFFLFSGYGMSKSAGDARIGWRFILKRFVNVYIPYLIIVIAIKLLAGGFASKEEVLKIFYGQDFWYMTVLFSFYLAFMAIWLVFKNRHIRALLMAAFTWWYSDYLYTGGKMDFWFISNIAFAVGVLFALYEPQLKKIPKKIWSIPAVLFGLGSVYVVYSALYVEHVFAEPIDEHRCRMLAVTVFILFVASLAAAWKWYDVILPFLGKHSIYLYLWHTYLFMWAVNHYTETEIPVRFVIATALILGVSIGMGIVMELLLKPVNRLLSKKKKKVPAEPATNSGGVS